MRQQHASWTPVLGPVDQFITRLVYASRRPGVGKAVQQYLKLNGRDFPPEVTIGPGLVLPHAAAGVVLHWKVQVGAGVTIYHGVTVGRGDVWREVADDFGGGVIGDDVILGAGAVVLLPPHGTLTIGRGTIVGANSVLRDSTGTDEIWAGNPARLVGKRPR
jgi:serine O-acetyltransferase